jgi:hypothetical protein
MNINLLDLNADILNIIGDYVKKGNERRIDKEDDFEKTDFIMNHLKENNSYLKMVVQKKKLKNMLKREN